MWWILLAGVILIAAAAAWVLYVGSRVAARANDIAKAASQRGQRITPAAAIALAPLPVASPLIERDGKDAFGYPRSYVDQAALRSLLGRGRYSDLSRYCEDFQKQFEADFHTEYFIRAVSDAFGSPEPELVPQLDAWVQATPASFAPYLARGGRHVEAGFAARGEAWAKNTDATNFSAMNHEFALARADLDHALELAPHLVAALRQLMRMSFASSARADFDTLARRAFDLCPACMQPRVVEQISLEPRWGGSYRQMKDAADAAPVQQNSMLRLLPGYAELDRADGFVHDEQLPRALEHAERAGALGENADFLSRKADIQLRMQDTPGALAALRRALELAPSSAAFLFDLARAEATAKDYRAAFGQLYAGLRIAPTSSDARRLTPTVVSGLVYLGWQAHKQGHEVEALTILDEAAELDPNRDVEQRRFTVLTAGFQGTDAELATLEQAAQAAPHDYFSHARLDYALSKRRDWPRIEAMWTRYLADNPADARAYRERSGTLEQEGRHEEARTDAQRGCDLGSSAACGLLRRFQ